MKRTKLLCKKIVLNILIYTLSVSLLTMGSSLCSLQTSVFAEETIDSVNYITERYDCSLYNANNKLKLLQYYDKITLDPINGNIERINSYLTQDYNSFLEKAAENTEFAKAVSSSYEYTDTVEINVTNNANGILSLKETENWYMGGVNNIIISGKNYNLNTGEALKLTDVFNMQAYEIEEYLKQQTIQYINANPNMSWWNDTLQNAINIVNNYTLDKFNYYIENNIIVLCYPVYELGPGAMGSVLIECPIINFELNSSSAIAENEIIVWQNHRYKVFDEGKTWEDAEEYCESIGGHLVTINSEAEQMFIENLLLGAKKNLYWLGYTDAKEEGKWKWITGEISSYQNWHPGEPNQETSSEDYCEIYAKQRSSDTPLGTWNDNRNDNHISFYTIENHGFICEWDTDQISNQIKVILNGSEVQFDQPPIMINDRVMVPIRAIAEKMGDDVKWSNYLNSALIVHADRMVVFRNNNENVLIYVDPSDISTRGNYICDVPPQEINGRTLTPIRAIGECLGAKVDWNNDTQTVIIEYDSNVPRTLKENAEAQLNAYWSSNLTSCDFASYSDEINEFFNSRSTWSDAFQIFWDDWMISLDILASGKTSDIYMLKNCFAEILSEVPDSDVKDFEVYGEILEWLSKTSKLADIDFTKVNETVNISAQTANALSKFGNAIDKAGIAIDLTKIGVDLLTELLNDYSTGMLYIDTIRTSLSNVGIEDSVVFSALNELENDYVNKCTNAIVEGALDWGTSAILKSVTGGAFNLAQFCKDILNKSVGNNDKADAIKNINCIYIFNAYIDKAYNDVRNSLVSDPTKIDEFIRLYNFEKVMKTKMYEAMDTLRKKSDQYTETRIKEQLEKLRNASYILWE